MEIASIDDDPDPSILQESNAPIFNEIPLSPDRVSPQTDSEKKKKSFQSILDKSISLDDDSLIKPLEPVLCNTHTNNLNNNMDPICSDVGPKTNGQEDLDPEYFLEEHDHVDLDSEEEKADINAHSDEDPINEENNRDYENEANNFYDLEEPDQALYVAERDNSSDVETDDQSPENSNTEAPVLLSILKKTSFYDALPDEGVGFMSPRRVSFPTDKVKLASYKCPEMGSTFYLDESWTADEILLAYKNSCKKHHTIELDTLKNQILEITNNINFSATLNLSSMTITVEVCETLEDIFKKVNFQAILIKDCDFKQDSLRELLNILEYYNCTRSYVVNDVFHREFDLYKLFCIMVSKSWSVEQLTFEKIDFNEYSMKALMQNIVDNKSLVSLKFSHCKFGSTQANVFVEEVSCNKGIKELYLPSCGLYTMEADLLSRLINRNHFIKVLDISNNYIGDRGMEALSKGLCTQTSPGSGISVLVIFNTQITEKSGPNISNIIAECVNLHTLNIGYNHLTDEFIFKIDTSLTKTKSLQGLGLQTTLITDKGVIKLAEAIQINTSLQKINLKGNKAIQTEGLEKLSQALTNSNIIKVELDETNRNCEDPQGFLEVVKQINAICTVNKTKSSDQTDDEVLNWSVYFSRKVSLNCEPIYYPNLLPVKMTPATSPAASPVTKNRFSVSLVPETKLEASAKYNVSKVSRFKVITLTDYKAGGDYFANTSPSEEDEEVSQFANVRSSVSSIDSVDSVSTNRDSIYDSTTPSGESD